MKIFNQALHLMAKRNNKNFPFNSEEHWVNDSWECLICGERLFATDEDSVIKWVDVIDEHGIKHLKEYNLLPFL